MDIEAKILELLSSIESVSTLELASSLGVDHQDVVGASKSLEADGYVVSSVNSVSQWKFSVEGLDIRQNGSPEFLLWAMLASGPKLQEEVVAALGKDAATVAMSNGMKQKLFKLSKEEGKTILTRDPKVTTLDDTTRHLLDSAAKGGHVDPKDADALKKRKLASYDSVKTFILVKGPSYAPTRGSKAATDLTREMLVDGSWQTNTFKKYNFNATGREPLAGQQHPLLKVRQEFREMFLELGFQEMHTQQWVESSFWNFDTLFVPQKHPARDAQDTFFISKPDQSAAPDADYLKRVKDIHEEGYLCDWSTNESARNVLRTHTTAVSSWVLNQLAQSSPLLPDGRRDFRPARFFSIDRVFRNEEMDKTHLCEFHQVEGFVVDRNLSLANMMHLLNQFFRRIGIEQLRFKPAFNPYTEPSMEIFGFHTGLKKWMEVGNSGVFRPEMLKPMGFDEDVTAIAWGLSLERPTMIKYGIKNIHELFGHKVDLRFIKRSKIARY
jgi:phenylalanyl-tRNA synthetase alpha chain